jgi:hypothetical protein
MLNRPIDAQWDLRGTTQKWFHSDLEWWFDKNQPAGWTKDSIEYRFNSEGFRMDRDLSSVSTGCDLYIGDSHTLGLGVNYEDTWAYKHHKRYGENVYVNMGVSGGCLDTVTRLLGTWVSALNPSNIYLLDPAPYRSEFILTDEIFVSGSWTTLAARRLAGVEKTDEIVFQDKLFKEYVSGDVHQHANRAKNLEAIQNICKNCNLFYSPHFPINDEYLKQARDGFHAGPDQHDKILDWFIGVVESAPLPSFW